MKRFVFTCGDINGIGPEIVIKTLQRLYDQRAREQLIFICPLNVFVKTYQSAYSGFPFQVVSKDEILSASEKFLILALPEVRMNSGEPTRQSGLTAFRALSDSFDLLNTQTASAVITAPVSKLALNMAGIKFPGQTEMFAEWSGCKNYLMTFLSPAMNAGLLTIHIPLKKVPSTVTATRLRKAIEVIMKTARTDLGIKDPKIAVIGLNPHAGENGILGNEESDIIIPVVQSEAYSSFVDGPYPPDAFFATKKYKDYDFILGMYHDQVLIPFKMINFNKGVNYTAGLPVVRTSPDHGCAFDIAGNHLADESSIYSAYLYAKKIAGNRIKARY